MSEIKKTNLRIQKLEEVRVDFLKSNRLNAVTDKHESFLRNEK